MADPPVVNSRRTIGTLPEVVTPSLKCETTRVPGVNGTAIAVIGTAAIHASHTGLQKKGVGRMIACLLDVYLWVYTNPRHAA